MDLGQKNVNVALAPRKNLPKKYSSLSDIGYHKMHFHKKHNQIDN